MGLYCSFSLVVKSILLLSGSIYQIAIRHHAWRAGPDHQCPSTHLHYCHLHYVSIYFLLQNIIHSTSSILFMRSAEHALFHHSVQAENTLSSGYKLACRHGTSMTVFFFLLKISTSRTLYYPRASRCQCVVQHEPVQGDKSRSALSPLSPLRRGARTTPSGGTCRRIIALPPRRCSTTTIPVEIVAIRAKSWRIREHM